MTSDPLGNDGPISPAPAQEVGPSRPLVSSHSGTRTESYRGVCHCETVLRLEAENMTSSATATSARCPNCLNPVTLTLQFLTQEELRQLILSRLTVQPNGCWFVAGAIQKTRGYCQVYVPAPVRKNVLAHRLAYEAFVGPIPDGHEVDHVCHNRDDDCPGGHTCLHRRCCNPDHLEAKTGRDNNLSGKSTAARNAVKTHCKRGHNDWMYLTDKNGKPFRKCGECARTAYPVKWRPCPVCGKSLRSGLNRHLKTVHREVGTA